MRWAVLIAGIVAIILAIQGLAGKRPVAKPHRLANLAFLISADVQLLLGLFSYAGSTLIAQAFSDFGTAMHTPQLRFFAMEHGLTAVLGIAALHIAYARAKRGPDDSARHRTIAIGFSIAMLLFILAIPWPWRALVGRPLWPW